MQEVKLDRGIKKVFLRSLTIKAYRIYYTSIEFSDILRQQDNFLTLFCGK